MSYYPHTSDPDLDQSNLDCGQFSIPTDLGHQILGGSLSWIGRPHKQIGYFATSAYDNAFEEAQLSRLRRSCNVKGVDYPENPSIWLRSSKNYESNPQFLRSKKQEPDFTQLPQPHSHFEEEGGYQQVLQDSPRSTSLGSDYPRNPQNSLVSEGGRDNSPQQPRLRFPTPEIKVEHAQLPRVRNNVNGFHGQPFAIVREEDVGADGETDLQDQDPCDRDVGSNSNIDGTEIVWPACDPMSDISYVNTRKHRRGKRGGVTRWNCGVLEYRGPLVGDDWVPAMQHHRSRKALIQQAAKAGSYREAPTRGKIFEDDITSFLPAHQNWGSERRNWPKILFQYLPKAKDEHLTIPKPWYHEGYLVLDLTDKPMFQFDELPWTLSSKLEPWRLLAYQRLNNNITLRDIRVRMPKEFKSKGSQGDTLLLNRLSMRITRFRKEAGCITWCKGGAPEIRNYLDNLLPPECHERNSTESFRNLYEFEIAEMDALTAGKHLGRTRGAVKDLSEARATRLRERAVEKARKLKEEFDAEQALLEDSPSSSTEDKKTKIKTEVLSDEDNLPKDSDDEISNLEDHFEPITDEEGDEETENAGEESDIPASTASQDADDEMEVDAVVKHRPQPETYPTMAPVTPYPTNTMGNHIMTNNTLSPSQSVHFGPHVPAPNQPMYYPGPTDPSAGYCHHWTSNPILEAILYQNSFDPSMPDDGTTIAPRTFMAQAAIAHLLEPTITHLSRIMRVHPATIPSIHPGYCYKVQWQYLQAMYENWLGARGIDNNWEVLVGLKELSKERAVWNVTAWLEEWFGKQPSVGNGHVAQVFLPVNDVL